MHDFPVTPGVAAVIGLAAKRRAEETSAQLTRMSQNLTRQGYTRSTLVMQSLHRCGGYAIESIFTKGNDTIRVVWCPDCGDLVWD